MDSSDGESWKPSGSVKMKRQTSRRGSSIKLKKKELKTEKEFERSRSHEDTMEMLSPKQNGFAEGDEGDTDEEGKQQGAIKGMWKKALKTLKSTDSKPSKLSKKGSFTKRKDSESEEEPQEPSKEVDPVYSLLKCAADLPKVHKAQKDGGHLSCKADGYDNTSKASSPTSSGTGTFLLHPNYTKQGSIEGAPNLRRRDSRATSPAIIANEQLHHIVDESLGSEFKTFYKLTSPVKKHPGEGLTMKNSPSGNFDHH